MTTPQGVNAELGPWIRMTFPPQALTGLQSAPVGEPLFVSWLLAFGILPFDRHVFVLAEVGDLHFIETSHSVLQKLWRHERYVTATGCRVRDVVTVRARFWLAGPIARVLASAVFRHRHKRLRLLYT